MICERNIQKSIKVKDMSSQSQIIYCLDCHSKGKTKEGLDHAKDCEYFIYDSLQFPLISKEWSAEETLRLMQGIMKCGMGNWTDISQQFVKTKTWEQCEKFYHGKLYVPGNQPIEYAHITVERDTSGNGNHVIREELNQLLELQIQAFVNSAIEFRKAEAREFEGNFQDFNLSPPFDSADGANNCSSRKHTAA